MEFSDTHLAAARVQLALLRDASPCRKFQLARSLTRTTASLAFRALRRANPELSERDLDLLFVARNYGDDLAGRVREYLERRLS